MPELELVEDLAYWAPGLAVPAAAAAADGPAWDSDEPPDLLSSSDDSDAAPPPGRCLSRRSRRRSRSRSRSRSIRRQRAEIGAPGPRAHPSPAAGDQ